MDTIFFFSVYTQAASRLNISYLKATADSVDNWKLDYENRISTTKHCFKIVNSGKDW